MRVIAMLVTNISTIKLVLQILTSQILLSLQLKIKKGEITSPELSARHVRREIEQQQGDQRVHSGTLNIIGEFGIGDIANRFVAGVDVMRNIRDIGPIYNQGIMSSDINIDHPNYTNPVAEHKNGNGNAYQYNHLKTVGVYIQDTAYFTDNFIMTGGLRYEYFDQLRDVIV